MRWGNVGRVYHTAASGITPTAPRALRVCGDRAIAEVGGLQEVDEATRGAGTSADVRLAGVTKRFGEVTAVDDLALEIPRGEFFAMLGPSGCGKTTTLRMIAGFEQPTEGRLRSASADVTALPPYKRNVNTVFQSYALFPHLSVCGQRRVRAARSARSRAARRRGGSAELHRARRRSRASRSASRGSSPAASSSGSRWPVRWSTTRACCCSTSRSARST